MALDPGMVGKTVNVGVSKIIEDGGEGMPITATLIANLPRRSNSSGSPRRRLTWAETGNEWNSRPTKLTAYPGESVEFVDVPCCDQDGWRLDGLPVSERSVAFTYTIRVDNGISTTMIGPFILRVTDDDPVDADLLRDLPSGTRVGVPVYGVDWTTQIAEIRALAQQALDLAQAGGGGGAAFSCDQLATCSITALADVDTTAAASGQGLFWNGSSWVPQALDRGTEWFTGTGAPVEPIPGSAPGDLYLDTDTGNIYQLAGA